MSPPAVELTDLFEQSARIDPAAEKPLDFEAIPHSGGVYLLVDQAGRRVQLAGTGRLRAALIKRLAPPLPGRGGPRLDLLAVSRAVYWVRCYSQFENFYRFYTIARTLHPAGYRRELAFGPAWFLHIDLTEPFPQFRRTTRIFRRSGQYLGPFPDRSAAVRFSDELVDLFDLCRYHDILRHAPHGVACTYKQIGRCPAPCDGTVPMDRYRRMLAVASAAAGGRDRPIRDEWTARMQQAATDLAFERAAQIKKRIDKLDALRAGHYRFVAPAEDFNFLIVQRHRGRKTLRPFFVRQGLIAPGEPFPIARTDERVAAWAETISAPPPPVGPDLRADHIALVTHFLFRRSDPGLYWRCTADADWRELPDRIRQCFTS